MSQQELQNTGVFVTSGVGSILERPAQVDEVVDAIVELARIPEAELAALVSSGDLRSKFPFRVRDAKIAALRRFADVEEAPARPLTDEEYQQFLRG